MREKEKKEERNKKEYKNKKKRKEYKTKRRDIVNRKEGKIYTAQNKKRAKEFKQ